MQHLIWALAILTAINQEAVAKLDGYHNTFSRPVNPYPSDIDENYPQQDKVENPTYNWNQNDEFAPPKQPLNPPLKSNILKYIHPQERIYLPQNSLSRPSLPFQRSSAGVKRSYLDHHREKSGQQSFSHLLRVIKASY